MRNPTSSRKLALYSLLAGALVLAGCSTTEKGSIRPLTQSEVRELFEKKTVTSRNLDSGTVSVSYYSTRKVTQIRRGDERTGRWRVKRRGEHCLRMEENEEVCRYIRLGADGIYRKYLSPAVWEEPIIEYVSFVPGKHLDNAKKKASKSRPLDIADMQRRLTAAGYNAGNPDGVWGPQSREALRRYQQAHGLPVTGEPSRSVARHLAARK